MSRTACRGVCLNGRPCSHRAQEGRYYCGKHIGRQERAERMDAAAAGADTTVAEGRVAVARAAAEAAEEAAAYLDGESGVEMWREAEAAVAAVGEARAAIEEAAAARARAAAVRAAVEMEVAEMTARAAVTRETRRNRFALPLTSSDKSVKVECEECDDTCPICLEEIKGEKVVCSNGHAVCEKHIIQSITANEGLNDSVLKCSVCRSQILTSQVSYACNALLDIVCNKSRGWNISDWNMMKDSVKNSERSKV